MNLTQPMPFRQALEARAVKQILPTDFRTQLLATIPTELRERAMFSAGVTNAEFLQRAHEGIGELAAGTADRASIRLGLKKLLESLGYQPVEGEQGTLTDLGSDARLNLILDTNLQQAQGYGHWMQGQQPEILDEWPAQELIRVRESRVPRDWPARWSAAGGEFFGDRMIALKNDPIWVAISAFGDPYPPFDFNSGMDAADVDRETAIEAGLIDRDTQIDPQSRDFNTDLQATPEVRDSALKEALGETLAGIAHFVGGVLRFIGPN